MLFLLLGAFTLFAAAVRVIWCIRKRKLLPGKRRKARSPDPIGLLAFILGALLVLTGVLSLSESAEKSPEPPSPGPQQTAPPVTILPDTQPTTQPTVTEPDPWEKRGGETYYRLPDGSCATGWQLIDGHRYYFNPDGTMYTGWLELEGQTRYFRQDGTMATGQLKIHGVTRFFTSEGLPIQVVNPWYSVPEDYVPKLVTLSTAYATDGCRVEKSCYEDLIAMIEDCNRATNNVCVVSAYRTEDYQRRLYENKVSYYRDQGLSREEAEIEAAKVVAVPGTSEHQLGLAVDIVDTTSWVLDERQAELPGQQWLMENCWRYGFILRYPENSTEVTGIIYEPWHYRYVGKDVAKELHDSGMLLETYIQRLTR